MLLTNHKKKKLLFLLSMALYLTNGSAQIHIGSQAPPHPSAALEISSADKGVLFPTVALTSVTDVTAIEGSNPVNGLLVFNTKEDVSIGLYKGLYAWNNLKKLWEHIVSDATFRTMLTSYYAIEDLLFAADVITADQSISNGATLNLTFNKQYISKNKDNSFDTGNNWFVVPETGFYKIQCGMELTLNTENPSDNAEIMLLLTKPAMPTETISVIARRINIAMSANPQWPLSPSIIYTGKLDVGTRIAVRGGNGSSASGSVVRKYFYVSAY
ncbi:MAG: hypothetical protein LBK65_01010 [Tannerellaceae bacterium]|jgi:hypothetical protein|nr:hypothetical protein [Tannerellaceae bacterium]